MMDAMVLSRLAEPLPLHDLGWKIEANPKPPKTRALVVVFTDARGVIERLTSVVGFDWSTEYEHFPDGSVECRLTVSGATRADVGVEPSGENKHKRKAAVSDALKRAAVHFGVGLYLYAFPTVMAEAEQNASGHWRLTRDSERDLADLLRRVHHGAPALPRYKNLDVYGYRPLFENATLKERYIARIRWLYALLAEEEPPDLEGRSLVQLEVIGRSANARAQEGGHLD